MAEEHESDAREAERRELETELLAAMQEEMRRIPVGEYLVGLLMSLSSMAFQHLGVTAETAGDRDLGQSRLAIDAFAALVEVLAGERPGDEIALYRSTLHQMRLAYVRVSEGVSEEPGHEAGETAGETEGGGSGSAEDTGGPEQVQEDQDDERRDEEGETA